MKRNFLPIVFPLIFASSVSFAQLTLSLGTANLHPGKIGLGIDGISGSPNLLLKVFLSDQVAGEVILGIGIDSPGGDAPSGYTKVTGTDFRFGLSVLYHITNDQVSPYVGVEGIFETQKDAGFYVKEPDSKNSILAGMVLGGEYFIIEKFSLGIKLTLGAGIGLERDVPKESKNIKFATSTVMTGRFYFN